MNWSKIKTALICLFLAIDLFLLGWDVLTLRGTSIVDSEVIENTVSLLSDRTIYVSYDKVKRETPRIGTVNVQNPLSDEADFIGKVLGRGYVKDDNRFYKDGKEVSIDGNKFKITEKKSIKSIEDAKSWLEENGISVSSAAQTEYMGKYIFRTFYAGYEVFGSDITVSFDGETAIAEGNALYVTGAETSEEKIRHVTSVLPRLISDGVKNCEIESITPGYMCVSLQGARFSEAVASPVYRIRLSDGREVFYDAVV